MPRITDHKKQRRKDDVHEIVRRTPNGLREMEIAERLNLERRTVHNYLVELEREGKIYKDGVLWLFDPQGGTWLRQLELAADEAFVLYLAARLLVKQSDKHNETAIAALSRLSEVLKTDLPVSNDIFQAAQELRKREKRPQYESTFSALAKAYLLKHPVRITYKPLYGQAFTTLFHIYLMEPSAIGYTIYVIGQSQNVQAMRSYKIERIEAAEIIYNQSYTIPPDFAGLAMLNSAWSIMTGEQTLRVVLRFNQAVTPRVLETNWHPAQDYKKQEDGSLRWWVDVADTTDMKPWIRGWGADVEVLEPEALREDMKGHARRAAEGYGITTTAADPTSRLLRLWGKTSQQGDLFHPAFYHMLDVAHVAQHLLSPRATPRWRNALGRALNADPATLHEWLPYLIALHDLGKLSTPFQMLNEVQIERLKREKFDFGDTTRADGSKDELRHTALGRLFLTPAVQGWPQNLSLAFLDMVSGHHGVYRGSNRGDKVAYELLKEPTEWAALRQHAQELLRSILCQQWPAQLPEPANVSAAIAALNGFCILCDWLGSDENFFTPRPHTPLWEYLLHSRQRAYARVEQAGFFQLAISHAPTQFEALFGFAPRPLQAAIDHIPENLLHHPTLTIIEAPTGEGKTEAALALARRIAALRGTDEMYIALPTTATSNAMYGRVQKYLTERLGLPPELVRLIHGQSFLVKDDLTVQPLGNGDDKGAQAAEDWFAPKKKALLAPIGVGTIDQAELSALNVRHNALRLIGLAGKTIILDEVHAYDTYMTTIIKRMLQWLSALGSSVILLSATLPTNRRRELAQAFAGRADLPNSNQLQAYPNLLTISPDGFYTPAELIGVSETNFGKQIALHMVDWGEEDTAAQAQWLFDQVQNGGCACWITNTVKRAQALYQALPQEEGLEVHLLHGRFSPAQRAILEKEIMGRYGQPSDKTNRPYRGIVIGTQVLEQSLDLDFDVMATDLAPIDLLLQRAGRLHRHTRSLATRHQHTTPVLYLNQTMSNADKAIYSEYILCLTQQALANYSQLNLPTDYRPLVETVYTARKPNKQDPLYEAWDKLDAEMYKLENNAQERLTDEPLPNDVFYQSARLQGFAESEDSNAWGVAQTRWAERETITLLPLVREGSSATIAGITDSSTISLEQKALRETQLTLLRHSIRISDFQLVRAIKNQEKPLLFESALLKHTYPLWLTPASDMPHLFISEDGFEKPISLHPQLGLVI